MFSRTGRIMKSPCSLRLSGSIAIPRRAACARALHDDRRARRTTISPAVEVVGAEDRPRDLGAAAADEAGEADDLARPDA